MVTAIVIGGGFIWGQVFTQRRTLAELAGVLDQLNPLVKEGNVYVKTKESR